MSLPLNAKHALHLKDTIQATKCQASFPYNFAAFSHFRCYADGYSKCYE